MRRSIAAALVALFVAVAPVPAAHAAGATGLSVSIQSDAKDLGSSDRVEYTATLRNGGTDGVEGRLMITVPSFVDVTEASGATLDAGDASWDVSVPAGGSVTEHLVGVLTDIPKGQLRVTTLVGFYLGDAVQPAIRSADAATIAGVKDPAHAVTGPAPKSAPTGMSWPWWVGGAALLLVAAVAVIVWRRRRARP